MGRKLRVSILASDSFGVRSMAALIETPHTSIVSDGGVALGMRYGLMPHPVEYRTLLESITTIDAAIERAQVVTVSHYHYDHYRPPFNSDFAWTWSCKDEVRRIYRDKIILTKDTREEINFSQRQRGWFFLNEILKLARRVEIADRRSFTFGDTQVTFSKPLPHGERGSNLGYVLVLTVKHEDEKAIIAPDVQGPASEETTDYIISEEPEVVFLGGPPTYLVPSQVDERMISVSVSELTRMVSRVRTTIIDHHLMRDGMWRDKIAVPLEAAKGAGHTLINAAEYMKRPEEPLESQRRQLYQTNPPEKEFIKWAKQGLEKRRSTRPPI